MATPNEQHAARGGRARVVGSAHQDGRQPLVEGPQAAAGGAEDVQRGLDAAAGDPRTADSEAAPGDDAGAANSESLHHPLPEAQSSPDNTDTDARA